MEKISKVDFTNQVHITSMMSVFLSPLLGLGMILAVPSLVLSYHIRKNYTSYDVVKIDKSIFYSIVGIGLSIIFFLIERNFVIK